MTLGATGVIKLPFNRVQSAYKAGLAFNSDGRSVSTLVPKVDGSFLSKHVEEYGDCVEFLFL